MKEVNNISQNTYPQESDKTLKAKEKLKQRLSEVEKKVTPEALKKIVLEIHDRINRLALERDVLKNKITLFDNNTNPANTSKKTHALSVRIKKDNEDTFAHLDTLPQTVKRHIITND
ncbi:MAG: hypothetical protein K1060chlam5_00203 [Candidatus Anoxychlamydiales bacterium]|nr:hypothetical protein [Candidatus Anoxychlamydiales bacterium]